MKTNTDLTPNKRFWLLLKPDALEIQNIYIYALFSGFINLSLPLGIQSIINLIQGGVINASWYVLVMLVILGIVLTGYMQIGQLKITENLQQKIFTRAAFEFAYRTPKLKLEAIFEQYAPELMNRFFDVVSVQKGLSKVLIDFSTASIQVFFGLLLLCFYHSFFVGFSIILVFLVYLIFKTTAHRGLKTSLQESEFKYKVAHWLQELARTQVTFKLAGRTRLPLKRTNEGTNQYITARENHFKLLKLQYILMILFKTIVAGGLLMIGSILVVDQEMNIGQFVAAEIIILMIMGSVEKLIMSLETIYDVLTSLEKIGQVTDLDLEEDSGVKLDELEDSQAFEVEVNNIHFTYPHAGKEKFSNISFNVASGEKVLICGANDIGKSTLLYLLAGLYRPNFGYIAYNKLPIGYLNMISLRSCIGDCLMEELLFDGSLLENITMGRPDATFENVQWAFKNLKLESFLKRLPAGYNTKISSKANQFSKEILDKLSIARSIVDKPKILLIRDSFSAILDSEKHEIMEFLTSCDYWTMIFASSDVRMTKYMDRMLELTSNGISEIPIKA